jgi:hypothetical protein
VHSIQNRSVSFRIYKQTVYFFQSVICQKGQKVYIKITDKTMKVDGFILVFIQIINLCDCKGVAVIHGGKARPVWRQQPSQMKNSPFDIRTYYVSFNIHSDSYGPTFGSNRLNVDTHIYIDNYKNFIDDNKPYLTESLYKSQEENQLKSELRGWTDAFERRWRRTTKMPYFANELPSEDSKLPAAAVVGKIEVLQLKAL